MGNASAATASATRPARRRLSSIVRATSGRAGSGAVTVSTRESGSDQPSRMAPGPAPIATSGTPSWNGIAISRSARTAWSVGTR